MASTMDSALKAVAAKSLDEAIVNTCIGMGIGVTLALVMVKSGMFTKPTAVAKLFPQK